MLNTAYITITEIERLSDTLTTKKKAGAKWKILIIMLINGKREQRLKKIKQLKCLRKQLKMQININQILYNLS